VNSFAGQPLSWRKDAVVAEIEGQMSLFDDAVVPDLGGLTTHAELAAVVEGSEQTTGVVPAPASAG
jgi:hypothetical protein